MTNLLYEACTRGARRGQNQGAGGAYLGFYAGTAGNSVHQNRVLDGLNRK